MDGFNPLTADSVFLFIQFLFMATAV